MASLSEIMPRMLPPLPGDSGRPLMPCEVCGVTVHAPVTCPRCHMAYYCSEAHRILAATDPHGDHHVDACTRRGTTMHIAMESIGSALDPPAKSSTTPADAARLRTWARDSTDNVVEQARSVCQFLRNPAVGAVRQADAFERVIDRAVERGSRPHEAWPTVEEIQIPEFTGADNISEREKLMEAMTRPVARAYDDLSMEIDIWMAREAFLEEGEGEDASVPPLLRFLVYIADEKVKSLLDAGDIVEALRQPPASRASAATVSQGLQGPKLGPLIGELPPGVDPEERVKANVDAMAHDAFYNDYLPHLEDASAPGPPGITNTATRLLSGLASLIWDTPALLGGWIFEQTWKREMNRVLSRRADLERFKDLIIDEPRDDDGNKIKEDEARRRLRIALNRDRVYEKFPRQRMVSYICAKIGVSLMQLAGLATWAKFNVWDIIEARRQIVLAEQERIFKMTEVELMTPQLEIYLDEAKQRNACWAAYNAVKNNVSRTDAEWAAAYDARDECIDQSMERLIHRLTPLVSRQKGEYSFDIFKDLNATLTKQTIDNVSAQFIAGYNAMKTRIGWLNATQPAEIRTEGDWEPYMAATQLTANVDGLIFGTAVMNDTHINDATRDMARRFGYHLSDDPTTWDSWPRVLLSWAASIHTPYRELKAGYMTLIDHSPLTMGKAELPDWIPEGHPLRREQWNYSERAALIARLNRLATAQYADADWLGALEAMLTANLVVTPLLRVAAYLLNQTAFVRRRSWLVQLNNFLGADMGFYFLWYRIAAPPRRPAGLDTAGYYQLLLLQHTFSPALNWRFMDSVYFQNTLQSTRALLLTYTLLDDVMGIAAMGWKDATKHSMNLYTVLLRATQLRASGRAMNLLVRSSVQMANMALDVQTNAIMNSPLGTLGRIFKIDVVPNFKQITAPDLAASLSMLDTAQGVNWVYSWFGAGTEAVNFLAVAAEYGPQVISILSAAGTALGWFIAKGVQSFQWFKKKHDELVMLDVPRVTELEIEPPEAIRARVTQLREEINMRKMAAERYEWQMNFHSLLVFAWLAYMTQIALSTPTYLPVPPLQAKATHYSTHNNNNDDEDCDL